MNDKDKTLNRLEMEMGVKSLIDNLDILLQMQVGYAKAVYNYCAELQNAGFNRAEALEIVKAHGMAPIK